MILNVSCESAEVQKNMIQQNSTSVARLVILKKITDYQHLKIMQARFQ